MISTHPSRRRNVLPRAEARVMALKGEIPFLSLHIVEQILLRLDVRTLFRCVLVCRGWNHLITSPHFISRCLDQSYHHSSNQILLVKLLCHPKQCIFYAEKCVRSHPGCRGITFSTHWDNDPFDLFHTIGSPPTEEIKGKGTGVIGVCNGLICLYNMRPLKFMLWNPTIRKYAWLPDPSLITFDDNLRNEWYDSNMIAASGFGFGGSVNDLKVVNFYYGSIHDNSVESVWVFSYITWTWKRLICSISHLAFLSHHPTYLNGVLHWNGEEEFIITFDLTHEVVGQISLPNGLVVDDDDSWGSNYICTIGDSLAVIQELYDDDTNERPPNTFSVWIMKEYKNHESWTILYSVRTTEEIFILRILGMRKNGDVILQMVKERQVRRYNPMTSTNVLVEELQKSVLFEYFADSLYLLEKKEFIHSY